MEWANDNRGCRGVGQGMMDSWEAILAYSVTFMNVAKCRTAVLQLQLCAV